MTSAECLLSVEKSRRALCTWGVVALLLVIILEGVSVAAAQDSPEIDPALEWLNAAPAIPSNTHVGMRIYFLSHFDPGHLAFLLLATVVAGALVLPGVVHLYSGLRRDASFDAGLPQCLMAVAILTCFWITFGYSLAFARNYVSSDVERRELHSPDPKVNHGTVWIGGLEHFMLQRLESHAGDDSPAFPLRHPTDKAPALLFVYFQLCVFLAAPVPLFLLLSGQLGVVGRMGFLVLWSTLVYCPLAFAIWGGGWLSQSLDFGGGTVIHLSIGVSALLLSIITRHFTDPDGAEWHADSRGIAIGSSLLWFGLPMVHAGHALLANGTAIHAALMTHIAASAGAVGWIGVRRLAATKIDSADYCLGAIAGVAGIASGCGFVTFEGAMIIGIVSGVLGGLTWSLMARPGRPDLYIRTFALHGAGGLAGCILTGVFATSTVARPKGRATPLLGVLEDHPRQLLDQALAVSATILIAAIGTYISWVLARLVFYRIPVAFKENFGKRSGSVDAVVS